MELFSPVREEEDEAAAAVGGAPRPGKHLPPVASKLEQQISLEDVLMEGGAPGVLMEGEAADVLVADLVKSPSKAPQASVEAFSLGRAAGAAAPGGEAVLPGRPAETPAALGRTRHMDIPSSLEKFKSLKIGLDSLRPSPRPPAPADANPFTPAGLVSAHVVAAEAALPPAAFVKGLIDEALGEFKAALRNDIQNLHVEIIKQSLAQQHELRDVIEEYLPAVKGLMEELQRVRDENERLKLRLYRS